MKYYECKDCIYFRIDEETGKGYCKQTYTDVNGGSSACDSIVTVDEWCM